MQEADNPSSKNPVSRFLFSSALHPTVPDNRLFTNPSVIALGGRIERISAYPCSTTCASALMPNIWLKPTVCSFLADLF